MSSSIAIAGFVVGGSLLLLFIHPYVTYPVTLAALRAVRRQVPPRVIVSSVVTDGSDMELLFCAYNEAAVLPRKIANLEQLKERYPGLRISAYDDGSQDDTLAQLTARNDLLRVLSGPGRQGKATGMKQLVSESERDYLVFTDANVLIHPDALAALRAAYEDPAVGGVCGVLTYTSVQGSATEEAGGLYWRLEERIKELESLTGNVMGADGALFSVRRALYPSFPPTVQDDFTVSMSVVFAGARLVRAAEARAEEEPASQRADEIRRKVRISARAYHTHRNMAVQLRKMRSLDRYKYVSHKILRWWGAPLAASSAVSLTIGLAALSALAAAAFLGLLALGALSTAFVTRGVIGTLGEIAVSIGATSWGTILGVRGKVFATWTPPPRS